MEFLKEDGSLDVERIDNLPLEEYEKVIGLLTEGQMDEYFAKQPEDVAKGPIRPIYVDNSMEEDGVDAKDLLNEMKDKLDKLAGYEQDLDKHNQTPFA